MDCVNLQVTTWHRPLVSVMRDTTACQGWTNPTQSCWTTPSVPPAASTPSSATSVLLATTAHKAQTSPLPARPAPTRTWPISGAVRTVLRDTSVLPTPPTTCWTCVRQGTTARWTPRISTPMPAPQEPSTTWPSRRTWVLACLVPRVPTVRVMATLPPLPTALLGGTALMDHQSFRWVSVWANVNSGFVSEVLLFPCMRSYFYFYLYMCKMLCCVQNWPQDHYSLNKVPRLHIMFQFYLVLN